MRRVLVTSLLLAGCPANIGTPDDSDPDDTSTEGCEVFDCADPACADAASCQWSDTMIHTSAVQFTGAEIQCPIGGFDVPFDVPDCETDLEAALSVRTSGDVCAACDRTYEGPITYVMDSCAELLNQTPPSTGAWGFVAVGPTERELWLPVDGTWQVSSTLTLETGVWVTSASDSVSQVPPSCGTAVQTVGSVAIDATFTDGS